MYMYIHITHLIRGAYVRIRRAYVLSLAYMLRSYNRFAHVRNYVHLNRMEVPEWKKNRMEIYRMEE